MNVGIRYPEGRTGRPREIGGRHVRKEEEGGREGGPEGLRQAHQARAGHAPEDAGARGLVQAYSIEDVPIDELDLTPGLIARAREERGDAPLS